ncbi:MAG: histidine kinase N-terminal 7TM domain-containing protein [Clostridia bacterium]|nr:histidine kinase N-terminal 7TM domain-containing protein [Clostridia bacterium]
MDKFSLIGLSISSILIIIVLWLIRVKNKEKNQMKNIFSLNMLFMLIWCASLMLQIINQGKILPVYFEYLASFGACFIPVSMLITGIIFSKTKIKFNKYYLFLLIIPILSIIILLTNDFHNLFYETYSTTREGTIYGKYFIIHTLYSYVCLIIAMFLLIYYSIKNSGFFSKQSVLLVLGTLIPLILNVLFTLNIVNFSIYITPMSFAFAIIIFAFAIFKFQFLNVVPVALQKINDVISDGYIVINENLFIIDFNKTLMQMFNIKNDTLRNERLEIFLEMFFDQKENIVKSILKAINKTRNNTNTITTESYLKKLDKYFNIEINGIFSKNTYLGSLILFKDITQHRKDQEIMKRQAEFAAFGEASGQVAHDINSPAMAVKSEAFNIKDIIKSIPSTSDETKEYLSENTKIEILNSIKNIENGMFKIGKITGSLKSKMKKTEKRESKIFNLNDLVNSIKDLMGSTLRNNNCTLNIDIPENIEIYGEENSLDRAITNIVQNAVEAYKEKNKYGDINIKSKIFNNDKCIIEIADEAGRNT